MPWPRCVAMLQTMFIDAPTRKEHSMHSAQQPATPVAVFRHAPVAALRKGFSDDGSPSAGFRHNSPCAGYRHNSPSAGYHRTLECGFRKRDGRPLRLSVRG